MSYIPVHFLNVISAGRVLQASAGTALAFSVAEIGANVLSYTNGSMSKRELKRKIAESSGGAAGSIAGTLAGATLGTSFLPGVGTVVGGLVGGMAGVLGGRSYSASIAERIFEEEEIEAPSNDASEDARV